ncbi:MAG: response regulator [Acidobacteria bacterium]|nr:response regulator [Acidobacteriota bacterium]
MNQAAERKILLVDDSPRIRPLVVEILSDLNCSILEAETAEQAMELAGSQTGDIHLLITDITMPGKNGLELATLLRERYPMMQVLYMSGYTLPSAPVQGFQFIEKPFRPETLVKKVLEMLGA